DVRRTERGAWLHAIWQTRYARDRESVGQLLDWVRQQLLPARDVVAEPACLRICLLLDVFEASLLGTASGSESFTPPTPELAPLLAEVWPALKASPVHDLVVWLRLGRLNLTRWLVSAAAPKKKATPTPAWAVELTASWRPQLIERLGLRRAAEL